MINLVQMELFKLGKRPMTWMLLLLQLGILVLGTVANLLSWRRADSEMQVYLLNGLLLPESLAVASQYIYQFGAILLAILAAASIGSEYSWGTLRQWLATGVSRSAFLTAKLLALGIVAFGFVVLPLFVMVLLSAIAAQMLERPLLTEALDPLWLMALIGRTTLTVLMPMVLAFLIGVVSRSQALGVGLALGAMVVDQITAPLLWSLGSEWSLAFAQLLPFWSVRALLSYNFMRLPNDLPDVMQQEHALFVLVIYTLLCIGTALFLFRRRDVSGAI